MRCRLLPGNDHGLVWARSDLSNDGVHPSPAGGQKVANMLLNFFKTDRGAKTWFAK
jgi:lysophospholipase L1-like esterase